MNNQSYLCVLDHGSSFNSQSTEALETPESDSPSGDLSSLQTGQSTDTTTQSLSEPTDRDTYSDHKITFTTAVDLITHQITQHHSIQCSICGQTTPDGYIGLKHVFGEHKRSDYIRAYDTSAKYIHSRESSIETIDNDVDFDVVQNEVDWDVIEDPDHVKKLLSASYSLKNPI